MKSALRWLIPLAATVVAACAGERPEFKPAITEASLLANPTVASFGHCSGHGCATLQEAGLSAAEWAEIRDLFMPEPSSPEDERARVARAVARFERLVGGKTGTGEDLGGTWPGFMLSGQLDCVDETMNTRTVLRLLEQDLLLRHHRIDAPAGRGNFFDGLPHRTAVLVERESGTAYAVDSWFYDNGRAPEVVLLASWLAGWKPAED